MAISAICLGIRAQKNIAHFGLTVNNSRDTKVDMKSSQFNLSENALRLLQVRNILISNS